jgi:PRTRC genetic system protein E
MFKELFPLAAKGSFSLLLSADEASGLMTVVVVPKHSDGGKDVPALAMPLKLTAAPDELDAGFTQAVLSYSTHRASLDEQVAATNEVIEVAKAAAVKKGAEAVTKAGAKTQRAAAPKAATGDDDADDDHGGDDTDDAPTAVHGVAPATAEAPSAGPGVPDLFGA